MIVGQHHSGHTSPDMQEVAICWSQRPTRLSATPFFSMPGCLKPVPVHARALQGSTALADLEALEDWDPLRSQDFSRVCTGQPSLAPVRQENSEKHAFKIA